MAVWPTFHTVCNTYATCGKRSPWRAKDAICHIEGLAVALIELMYRLVFRTAEELRAGTFNGAVPTDSIPENAEMPVNYTYNPSDP